MSVSTLGDPGELQPSGWSWRPYAAVPPGLTDEQSNKLADLDREIKSLLPSERSEPLAFPKNYFKVALGDLSSEPNLPKDNDEALLEVIYLGQRDLAYLGRLEEKAEAINKLHPAREATISPSLRMVPAEVWSPGEASSPYLGTSKLALAQIRAAVAHGAHAKGQGVVVVIVDQGINLAVLGKRCPTPVSFEGGWSVLEGGRWIKPGQWPDGHGTKMAELVLSVAPQATILDLPLLPRRIHDLRSFLDWGTWIYWSLPLVIELAKLFNKPTFKGPWLFCNAWSVYSLKQDFPASSPWNYGDNPNNVFNKKVAHLPSHGWADIVFAAGNNGQFAPDPRSAPQQIGPGRSIYGVAALPQVLTVGAVRNDEIWLGYSAQGGTPPAFKSNKPDLVAPSQFTAPSDAARGYTGTSASCALAAGALAAVRSKYPGPKPDELLQRVRSRARQLVDPTPEEICVGKGMLDLERILFDGTKPWNGQPNPAGTPSA